LRRDVLSQFFINRAEYINCNYNDTNYKVRYYIPFKDTRKLADSSKNSTYNPNRSTTRENTSLDLLTKIPEKSKNRSLNTESREIFIPSDNDRKSFF
jgi:hypothetical protein